MLSHWGLYWSHRKGSMRYHASRMSSFIPRLFGLVMIYRHTQSLLLSPPRHACLRHASRAQARAPTAPSSYHMSQIVRSPAYSAGLCAHDFSARASAFWPVAFSAMPAPSLSAQGVLGCSDRMSPLRYDNAFAAPYDTSSGVFTRLVDIEKEIV